jgi:hypothetical protein
MSEFLEVRKIRMESKQNQTATFIITKQNKSLYMRKGAIKFFLGKKGGKIVIEKKAHDNYPLYKSNADTKVYGIIQNMNLVNMFLHTYDLKVFEITKISEKEFTFKPTV